jgi:methionyl-tRNA formyltransferase
MRIVYMGTPYFGIRPLEMLTSNGYDIVAVYTQPDRPMGRGRVVDEPPVKKAALKLNLNVVQPDNLKSTEEITRLAGLKPDAIVVAAYGQILRQTVLDIPPFGCINIHPSLLPVYRGMSPIPSAILNGDEFTGVSIMLLDKGVDTGPILERAQIPVSTQDNTGLLMEKLSWLGAQLLLDTLPRWFSKMITPQPQNNANASYTKTLTKEVGKIDWNLSAMELWRRVRAYHPWPGCYTQWQGKQLKIIEAVPLTGEENTGAGKVVVVKHESAAFGIGCGDGILGVIRLQLEGKKVMTAEEFLRGQQKIIGAALG